MIIIPDLFTPWIEGREKGIERNWKDRQNFNSVQSGQLDNLKKLGTLNADINRAYEQTDQQALQNLYNEQTFDNRVLMNQLNTEQAVENRGLEAALLPDRTAAYQRQFANVGNPNYGTTGVNPATGRANAVPDMSLGQRFTGNGGLLAQNLLPPNLPQNQAQQGTTVSGGQEVRAPMGTSPAASNPYRDAVGVNLFSGNYQPTRSGVFTPGVDGGEGSYNFASLGGLTTLSQGDMANALGGGLLNPADGSTWTGQGDMPMQDVNALVASGQLAQDQLAAIGGLQSGQGYGLNGTSRIFRSGNNTFLQNLNPQTGYTLNTTALRLGQ